MALSNIDILSMCKNIPNFQGVYSKDKLPSDKKNGFYILNLQSENQGNKQGTHWCFLYKTNEGTVYSDSYGGSPPDEILKFASKPIIYSDNQYQDFNSEWCGNYCIWMMKQLSKPSYGVGLATKYRNILHQLSETNFEYNKQKILS